MTHTFHKITHPFILGMRVCVFFNLSALILTSHSFQLQENKQGKLIFLSLTFPQSDHFFFSRCQSWSHCPSAQPWTGLLARDFFFCWRKLHVTGWHSEDLQMFLLTLLVSWVKRPLMEAELMTHWISKAQPNRRESKRFLRLWGIKSTR